MRTQTWRSMPISRETAAFLTTAGLGGFLVAGAILAGGGRFAFLVSLAAVVLGTAYLRVWNVMLLTLWYLFILGDLRRAASYVFGIASPDPLLLVGPAVAGTIAAWLLASKQVTFRTPLSKLILALMGLMMLQILNPAQGGLAVGLGGALFYLVPLCWYWAGYVYGSTERAERLLKMSVLAAVLAALLGLYQTYVGFLPFEQHWIDTQGYASLWISRDTVRPFSFLTSGQEYAGLVSIAVVVTGALVIRRRALYALPLLALLILALFLGGSRGPLVKVLVAGSILWAVHGRTVPAWGGRLVVALIIGATGAVWALNEVAERAPSLVPEATLSHQVDGLLNPLDEEHSTASVHLSMFGNGIEAALETPLGRGLGSTTRAAATFGGQKTSTEVDLSNVGLALGLLGLVLYGVIIALVLVLAIRFWLRTRSFVALGLLGALVVSGGTWLLGGMYSIVAFLWLCIGMLDRCVSCSDTGEPVLSGALTRRRINAIQ